MSVAAWQVPVNATWFVILREPLVLFCFATFVDALYQCDRLAHATGRHPWVFPLAIGLGTIAFVIPGFLVSVAWFLGPRRQVLAAIKAAHDSPTGPRELTETDLAMKRRQRTALMSVVGGLLFLATVIWLVIAFRRAMRGY